MAIPVAMGIEGMTSPADAQVKARIASGTPPSMLRSSANTSITSIQTNVRAAAKANHLICCCSSPLARRKRTNSEITAPSPASSIIGSATNTTNTCTTWDGFSSPVTSAGPLSGQSPIVEDTTARPMERPPSQATHRQRYEGGCPSGNSSGRNTRIRPSPGAQIHCPSQEASAPNGRAPGLVRSA
jgi:hypothetical protein